MQETHKLLEIYTDGGSRGNPGPAGIGVYAISCGTEVFTISEAIGVTTNNVAEYTAVIRSLEKILEKEIIVEKLKYTLDSELIVRQILGKYKVKLPHLKLLRHKVVSLIKELHDKKQIQLISFNTVPRELNKNADSLVNEALDR